MSGWGGRRGIGRWERLLTSLTQWTFVVDLLPRGCSTASHEYRALHRAARPLEADGLIAMVTFPTGSRRSAVGPIGTPCDLKPTATRSPLA